MINGLVVRKPTKADAESVHQVFEAAIPAAFAQEGMGSLHEEILQQVGDKKRLFDAELELSGADIYCLVAELAGTVVGTISFGRCGNDIKKCTENQLDSVGELGSLYILPYYQGQGIGSTLIKAMVEQLYQQGIKQFCLDSGYKSAQKRWLRKFGSPYKVVKDYWGPNIEHMIWLCNVSDFI